MRIYAISDLHLSFSSPKPMDIFDAKWGDHFERISEAWRDLVSSDDVVLIPGDISWAMKISDASADLSAIGALPGKKVIVRGNHDYWWSSIAKVRSVLPEDVFAIQNDYIRFSDVIVCGSRGWICPGSQNFKEEDDKIYKREVMRMGLSLKSCHKKTTDTLIALIHYPPFNEKRQPSGFVQLFEQYKVDYAIYGHLHDKSCKHAFEGLHNGINYSLVSCDHLNFIPKLIAQV